MSWLAKVVGHVHGAAVKVSGVFVKVFGQKEAEHFASAALHLLKSELGKIALASVEEVSHFPTEVDKRRAAFTRIVEVAKSAGVDYKDSVINLLIELAVGALKGHFGPS